MPIEHKYGCIILTGEESKGFIRRALRPAPEEIQRQRELRRKREGIKITDIEGGFVAEIPGLVIPKEENNG